MWGGLDRVESKKFPLVGKSKTGGHSHNKMMCIREGDNEGIFFHESFWIFLSQGALEVCSNLSRVFKLLRNQRLDLA